MPADHEGAGGISTLALPGVGTQPAVKLLSAALEAIDAVVRSERLDRSEPRAHLSRTLGLSVKRPRPASKEDGSGARAEVVSFEDRGGGWFEAVTRFTFEVEGNEKPCFVGDSVTRMMAAG